MTEDIAHEVEKLADELGIDRKKSIGEVAKELKVETHVIRFWEEHFPQIRPEIGVGKRRYYYNRQLKILKRIKRFLYEEGYTVAGLQKLLKRRKQDDYKEEDLDIIVSAQSQENNINQVDDLQVLGNSDIESGAVIDPQAKIMNFAKIKISAIDPKVSKTIEQSVKSIRDNLEKLKAVNAGLWVYQRVKGVSKNN